MSTSERQKSCEERIDGQLAGRLEDLENLFTRQDNMDDEAAREAAIEEMDEFPLSVEFVTTVRVVIGTGGPHDEFTADIDDDGDVHNIRYRFTDWFDGAERRVDSETAERFMQYWAELRPQAN